MYAINRRILVLCLKITPAQTYKQCLFLVFALTSQLYERFYPSEHKIYVDLKILAWKRAAGKVERNFSISKRNSYNPRPCKPSFTYLVVLFRPRCAMSLLRCHVEPCCSTVDLQLRPYRTDDFLPKLFYETARFNAFTLQWVVKARVNDHVDNPIHAARRSLSYQLILKVPFADISLFLE